MSDLHFVLEHPQDNNRREHKKRPRLVTSCDNWYVGPCQIRLTFRADPSILSFIPHLLFQPREKAQVHQGWRECTLRILQQLWGDLRVPRQGTIFR